MIQLSPQRSSEIQLIARKLLMDVWVRGTIKYRSQVTIDEIDEWDGRVRDREKISGKKGLRARWRR